MRIITALLILTTLFLGACSETEDGSADLNSEASCSTASGTWVVSGATCNSTAVSSVGTRLITFNSLTSATQSQGETACLTSFDWDIAFGDFSPTINLTGNGSLSCSANGASVSSCSGATNSCDSTTSITGIANNYSTCVITDGVMSLTRTVSSTNNTDNLSYCADGEEEVVSLSPATDTTTDAAVLSIAGTNPANFSSVNTGSNSQITLTVSNTGTVAATSIAASGLSAPFTFFGGSYPGTGGSCTTSLAASASCTLVVSFAPTATGAAIDTLNLSYNDSSAVQTLAHGLSGTGTSGGSTANLTISDGPTYDFGSVSIGSSTSYTFTVTNSGSATATSLSGSGLAAPFSFSGGSYPGTGGTCSATLAAAATCTLVVSYSPTSAGLHADTISLSYNDGVSAQVASRNVQGTGISAALLVISESDPYDFGSIQVGFTGTHVFTVTNTGGATATSIFESGLAAPFSFNGGAYPGIGGTCGAVISAGSNCNLDIVFSPVATGVASDSINLNYNDGASSQMASRNVTGTGTP